MSDDAIPDPCVVIYKSQIIAAVDEAVFDSIDFISNEDICLLNFFQLSAREDQ
jgi:hypothetical protein